MIPDTVWQSLPVDARCDVVCARRSGATDLDILDFLVYSGLVSGDLLPKSVPVPCMEQMELF